MVIVKHIENFSSYDYYSEHSPPTTAIVGFYEEEGKNLLYFFAILYHYVQNPEWLFKHEFEFKVVNHIMSHEF